MQIEILSSQNKENKNPDAFAIFQCETRSVTEHYATAVTLSMILDLFLNTSAHAQ